MNQKREANLTAIIVSAVCVIMAAAGGLSMVHIISRLNGWQAAGYALVGGDIHRAFRGHPDQDFLFF